jgi:hypothetical protein
MLTGCRSTKSHEIRELCPAGLNTRLLWNWGLYLVPAIALVKVFYLQKDVSLDPGGHQSATRMGGGYERRINKY